MKTILNRIQIIYTEIDLGVAEDILSFLKSKEESRRISNDAAVIIVSDEATEDAQWQKEVRSLNQSVRLIPIGAIINADYSDPDVIPPRIEELNFIRIDEDLHENIWESLTIDQDFYDVRNTILVNMNSWIISEQSDAFLMSDYGQVKKCLKMTEKKAADETDQRFKQQLDEMKEYLSISKTYARKIFFRSLRQRFSIVLLAALFAGVLWLGITVVTNLQRAARESALLGVEPDAANAAENFVLLSDGIDNPFISSDVRNSMYNEMLSYLPMSWPTTPTGYNYKYRLYDPHFLGDERYLMTMSSNRDTLIWDTYTGKIDEVLSRANDDLKAYYVDMINGFVVIVREDNVILFGDGESNEWKTNNVQYPFTGNSDIRVLASKDHIMIYDDKCNFLFDVSDGVRPFSYLTPDTMRTDNYRIHQLALTDSEAVYAIEVEGVMAMHYSSFTDDPTTILSTVLAPKKDCPAAVSANSMVFADEEGNIVRVEREARYYNTVGLKLPDVRNLALINDTILVYYDRLLGTHLYDLENKVELGELFTGFGDIEALGAGNDTVFCYANGAYHCQSVKNLLPLKEVDERSVLNRFSGTSPADEGRVSNIFIKDQMLYYDLQCSLNESGIVPFVVDGSHMMSVGEAVSDKYEKGDRTGYIHQPLVYTGDITAVGVIDNGGGLVFGTADGCFRELTFTENGGWRQDGSIQVPTHAAVEEIIETEDCYYVKDALGLYWYCLKRYPAYSANSHLVLDQINEKLRTHGYFPQDFLDSISKQTIEDMGLQVLNGSDGKEWE